MSHRFNKTAGAFLIGVATTVASQAIVSLILAERSADLNALVELGTIPYPPKLSEELLLIEKELSGDYDTISARVDEYQASITTDRVRSILTDLGEPENNASTLAPRLALRLRADAPSGRDILVGLNRFESLGIYLDNTPLLRGQSSGSPTYEGYWRAIISNRGEKRAASVKLHLPNARYAVINESGKDPVSSEVNEDITIDELLPRQQVEVVAWTPYKPSVFEIDNVGLVYSEGVGEVERAPREQTQSDMFWSGIRSYSVFILIALTISAFVVLFPYIRRGFRGGRGASKNEA